MEKIGSEVETDADADAEAEVGLAKVRSEISKFGQNLFLASPFQIFDRASRGWRSDWGGVAVAVKLASHKNVPSDT